MDYQKHYKQLILRANGRRVEGYSERHHIIPKCLGGSNEDENIAVLTAREHYIAHQLLIKLHPTNPDLVYAAKAMTFDKNGNRINNRLYEWIKKKHASAVSKNLTGRKQSKEHKQKRSQALKQAYADGSRKAWNAGKTYKSPATSIALMGRPNIAQRKPIIIDGVLYESYTEAATTFDLTLEAIRYWVKTGKYGAKLQ